MEKPRILFITSRTDTGGGPKYLVEFLQVISPKTEIFSASPLAPPYGKTIRGLSVDHYEIPHRSFQVGKFLGLLFWARAHRISTVHSHGRGAGVYARLLHLFGFRVIHSFHGVHREKSFFGWIKFKLDQILDRLTDLYVFTSEAELNAANDSGLSVAGKTLFMFPKIEPITDLALKPRTPEAPLRLGALSRMDPVKGLENLVTLLSIFHSKHPEIQWEFFHAGGIPDFKVPLAISKRVHFIGETLRPMDFLAGLDIFLSGSISESFNLSVLEAISSGLKVVVSEIPGHSHYLNAKIAIGFDLQDVTSFEMALLSAIEAPSPGKEQINSFLAGFDNRENLLHYLRLVANT